MENKKSWEEFKTNTLFYIIAILGTLFSCLSLIFLNSPLFKSSTDKYEVSEAFGLSNMHKVHQILDLEETNNRIDAISIRFGTYNQINQGTLYLTLLKNDEPVENWSRDISTLADNEYTEFGLSHKLIVDSTTKNMYSIELWVEYNENAQNKIAIWLSKGGTDCFINGNCLENNSLCYFVNLQNRDKLIKYKTIGCVLYIVFFLLITLNRKKWFIRIKNLVCICAAVLFFSYIVQYDLLKNINGEVEICAMQSDVGTNMLKPGEKDEFAFEEEKCSFDYFEFFLDDLQYENDVDLNIQVINSNNEICYEGNVTSHDILAHPNTEQPMIKLQSTRCFERGKYKVFIKNDGRQDVKILTNQNKELVIRACKFTNVGLYLAAIVIFALILMSLFVIMLVKRNAKWENIYLALVIPLSVIYLLLMAPWNTPDAKAHYAATYRFSNILLGYENNERWMGREEDAEFYNEVWDRSWGELNPSMLGYSQLIYTSNVFTNKVQKVDLPFHEERMEYYSFINYMPQILGLSLGRICHMGAIFCIYLARLFALAFFVWAGWNAVKITPIGKSIFTVITILPMSLMMSSAFSYDSMVLITTLNLVASVFALYQSPNEHKYFVHAVIWSFFVGATKGGGYLLVLPLVLVLLYKYKDKRQFTVPGAIVLSGLFSVVLFDKLLQIGKNLFQFGESGNGKMQASFAIYHPFIYIRMCVATYMNNLDDLVLGMGGTSLGWLERVLPSTLIFLLIAITCIYSLYERDELQLIRRDKIICNIVVGAVIVFTPMMLLSWTDEGSTTVLGLQGRYYLPVLVLILISATKHEFHMDYIDSDANVLKEQKVKSKCIYGITIISVIIVYYLLRIYLER